MNSKKLFLYLLIASVGASALIGVGVILFGNFGEFETKVLLTALTVTVTSILGLACGACLEAGKGRVIPMAGIVFAVISAVLWMFMIWSEFRPDNHNFANSVMSATLLAASCSLVSLLSLATLDSRFMWSRILAHAAVWSLTALILWIIWSHIDPSDSWIARTMGVLSIIIAAVTVVTPVFYYLSSSEKGVEGIDAEIERLKERLVELEEQKNILSLNKKSN